MRALVLMVALSVAAALGAPAFAQKAERTEDWPVGVGEQHRLAPLAGMLVRHPGRHGEGVPLLPGDVLAADDAVTAAFRHVVDGAGRVAVRLGVLALPQQLQKGGHGRHGGAAIQGVAVLDNDPVER